MADKVKDAAPKEVPKAPALVRVRYVGNHRVHFTRLKLVFNRNDEHEMTADDAAELRELTPGEEFEVE